MGFDLPDRIKKTLIYCQTDVFCNPFVTQNNNGFRYLSFKLLI